MTTTLNHESVTPYVENPIWRTSYSEDTTTLLRRIPRMFKAIRTCFKDPDMEEYVCGFIAYYRANYITECNRGEKTGTQTIPETEQALAQPALIEFKSHEERASKKTQNLSNAIHYIFGTSLVVQELEHKLTPELAKQINMRVGNGLFQNAGSYRQMEAKPAGYNYYYTRPVDIENEMTELFDEISRTEVNDQNWFIVAAKFLEKFLKIHPFSNGNGRTARILLSTLLVKQTIVPVFLFHYTNEAYLNCLQEAHEYGHFSPLNSLIIDSTFHTLLFCVVSLDLEVRD